MECFRFGFSVVFFFFSFWVMNCPSNPLRTLLETAKLLTGSSEGHGGEDLTTEPRSFDAAGCVCVVHHPPRLPLTWEQALCFGPGPRQEQTLRNHANLEEAAAHKSC